MKAVRLSALAVIIASLASAEWIDFGTGVSEAEVTILEQSNSHTTFEVTIPGIEVEQVDVEGQAYSRLNVPGALPSCHGVGRPEVPRVSVLLAIPNGAQVSVSAVAREGRAFKIPSVYPAQPPLLDGEEPGEFIVDVDLYEQDVDFPGEDANLVHTAVWHDLKVANIQVYPVQANPARGEVVVAPKIRVQADYVGGAYPRSVAE